MPWLATKSSSPGSGAGSPNGIGMKRPLDQAGRDTSADASWGDRAAPSSARFRQDGRHVNRRRTAASGALAGLGEELRLLLAADALGHLVGVVGGSGVAAPVGQAEVVERRVVGVDSDVDRLHPGAIVVTGRQVEAD